jgi:hypothetical protein
MQLLATRELGDELEVTLADGSAVTRLIGSPQEIAALCDAMEQAAVLAGASPRATWLPPVRVGANLVRLGFARGRVRMVTGPAEDA